MARRDEQDEQEIERAAIAYNLARSVEWPYGDGGFAHEERGAKHTARARQLAHWNGFERGRLPL
jgi:hypothetical protein